MERLICALILAGAACAGEEPVKQETPIEQAPAGVVEEIHGVKVADPFRWLEDGEDPKVQAWVVEQNRATRTVLDAVPGREALRTKLEGLLSAGSVHSPVVRKGRIFYQKRTALQNQPVLLVRIPGTEPRVLLDPNTLSREGTTALDWWVPSNDGTLLAYGLSEGGSEISTLHVLDVDGKREFSEKIPHCRAASVAWLSDKSGFYYTRYPAPGDVVAGEEKYFRRVFFHKLGDDPRNDVPIFGEKRKKTDWPAVALSPDDRWLLVAVFQGWSKSELYLQDRQKGGGWVAMVEGVEATFAPVLLPDRIYVLTNDGAPRQRILCADPASPARSKWKEVVPEGEATIEGFEVVGDRLVLQELHRAHSRLRICDREGAPVREIELPTMGSVEGSSGEWDGKELLFGFQSFFHAPSILRCDVSDGATTVVDQVETSAEVSRYETSQVEYRSKDGTPITMFLVHRKGLERDGGHPTILTGYGGFKNSLTPAYSSARLVWLERGGMIAIPNLRGGGEYGEEWHRAGMLEKKQNVFDDFLAAAEWLIREKYTSPEKLAISGGSNGGLLVGAALTQRPDLFRAVVCSVPLLDMIRYHRFPIAELWVPEYGSAEEPEQFQYLFAYSPYHHVQEGVKYPAVLLMTAESDTRVNPLHARKMAALLQKSTGSDRPVLLRVEPKAGHGAGKPLSKAIDEAVDLYSFLFEQLGMRP